MLITVMARGLQCAWCSAATRQGDRCFADARAGTNSYVLFTLDKLIMKVVKQMQVLLNDDLTAVRPHPTRSQSNLQRVRRCLPLLNDSVAEMIFEGVARARTIVVLGMLCPLLTRLPTCSLGTDFWSSGIVVWLSGGPTRLC